jgi:hypothetical protein
MLQAFKLRGLLFVFQSLCVFAPLRALRETKNFVPLRLCDFVSKKMLQAFHLRGLYSQYKTPINLKPLNQRSELNQRSALNP